MDWMQPSALEGGIKHPQLEKQAKEESGGGSYLEQLLLTAHQPQFYA